MKKSICFLIFVGLFVSPAPVLAEEVFTLERCVKYGLKNNPSLLAAGFAVGGAEQDLKVARADFLPQLSASASYSALSSIRSSGTTETDFLDQGITNYSVRLSQVLYAGSRVYNTYSRAEARQEMVEAERDFTRLKLVFNIERVFFELMKAEQDVVVARDTVRRLTAGVESARAFVDRKMAPYVQRLQAEVDLADAMQRQSQVKNNVERKRAELFSLLNMAFSPDVRFAGGLGYYPSVYETTFEASWEKAAEKRPDLQSLDRQRFMAEKSVAIAMGKYYPTVNFDLGWFDQDRNYDQVGTTSFGQSFDRDQRNEYWTAGVSVSWSFFDGGRAWYEKGKYLMEIKRLKEQVVEVENSIMSDLRTALFDMSEAETRIEFTAGAVKTAVEYYQREDRRFQAGISTMPSLLDAQERLTRAESNYTQALLDYQVARSALKFITGGDLPPDKS